VDEPVLAVERRACAVAELGERRYDLLVIGGGIIGAGIAEAASAHGLAVALVDKGDFGGGTSTASSKLIHGGLRYLRLGDVRLVREAHQERRTLMRVVAPHLVRRQPFLFPLYEGGPYRPWFVQTGILLYSTLARARLNGPVPVERARRLVPGLRGETLRSCALYADAVTNDGRLTLANVRAAADVGATVLNYAEVVALRGREGADVVVDGETVRISAKAVVNASGAWVDHVRRLEDARAEPSVRLSKGVHVLVEGGQDWAAALTIPHDKVRVSFAVPWEGMLLLGTTDTLHDGDPGGLTVTDEDVEQVIAEASVAVEGLQPGDVRVSFAGLRVLPVGSGETATARRETVFSRGAGGMVSIAGGKLTTYRRIALDALEHLRADLGLHSLDRRPRPLPGAAGLSHVPFPDELRPETRTHLLDLYGSLAADVLTPAREDPSLLEPIVPGCLDLRAQEVYARECEWAVTDEDVLRRRTTAWLAGAPAQAGTAAARSERSRSVASASSDSVSGSITTP
jgi:glycerol-3-phosphate dehydrogenase